MEYSRGSCLESRCVSMKAHPGLVLQRHIEGGCGLVQSFQGPKAKPTLIQNWREPKERRAAPAAPPQSTTNTIPHD
jgi:hypothetical protein